MIITAPVNVIGCGASEKKKYPIPAASARRIKLNGSRYPSSARLYAMVSV